MITGLCSGLPDRFDPCGKTRHFARRRVFVIDAFGHAAHQLGLCQPQSRSSGVLVTRGDCLLDSAKMCANARTARLVDFKTTSVLTSAFFRLGRISHGVVRIPGLFVLVAQKIPLSVRPTDT